MTTFTTSNNQKKKKKTWKSYLETRPSAVNQPIDDVLAWVFDAFEIVSFIYSLFGSRIEYLGCNMNTNIEKDLLVVR